MADVKNPKRVISTFKTACEKKGKAIDHFLAAHTHITAEHILELKKLNDNLKDQFNRMETNCQNLFGNIEDCEWHNVIFSWDPIELNFVFVRVSDLKSNEMRNKSDI